MQHNDGGNPEKKDFFFTADGDGNGSKENTNFAPPLCNRSEGEIEVENNKDEEAGHCS